MDLDFGKKITAHSLKEGIITELVAHDKAGAGRDLAWDR